MVLENNQWEITGARKSGRGEEEGRTGWGGSEGHGGNSDMVKGRVCDNNNFQSMLSRECYKKLEACWGGYFEDETTSKLQTTTTTTNRTLSFEDKLSLQQFISHAFPPIVLFAKSRALGCGSRCNNNNNNNNGGGGLNQP